MGSSMIYLGNSSYWCNV